MPYTCVTCARRKVKCDKIAPACSTCKKARLECEYSEPAPRKRKRRPADDVHERLDQYERILKQNGLLPTPESTTNSPATTESQPGNPFSLPKQGASLRDSRPGKLLSSGPGTTRFIDSNVWRNLGHDDFPASSDDEDEPESIPIQGKPAADPVSAAFLSPISPSTNLVSLHPTYESAMKLWTAFVENVDPIIKVVHVPTARSVLQRAASNPSSASRPTEALLFAIYHFAVISLSHNECMELFGEPQARLVARYHDALRHALVNAHFLKTKDLSVCQAYIMFLLAVRNTYESNTFWILTGIGVRIAQRIGLHRDGEEYNLKPFDVEVRRRVFWQLLPLDGLASQMCGVGICITPDQWDVKQPLNINDADIWPEMTEPPEPHAGPTDMIFCLARTELALFAQKFVSLGLWPPAQSSVDINDIERHLQILEDLFETKYLRYCDFANPLHVLTMAMARTSVNAGRLRVRLPHMKNLKDVPEEEKKQLWIAANKILDYDIAANNNEQLAKFRWHLKAFFQWNALVWMLETMQRDPLSVEMDVWQKIEKVYLNHPEMQEPRRSLQVAAAQMVVRTWDHYHSQQPPEKQLLQPELPFITAIREHLNRRELSRSNSTAPPTVEYNAFNPYADVSEDMPSYNFAADNPQGLDYFVFPGMQEGQADASYWMFWDQFGTQSVPNDIPSL